MKSGGDYPNRMRIFKIDVSEGGKVTGMFSENRKATDFDRKSGRKIYKNESTDTETVSMSYTFEIAQTKANGTARNLKNGDIIIVPVDKWSLNGSEEYTDKNGTKKYTTPRVVVWEWFYDDKTAKTKAKSESASKEQPPEDDIPF